MIIALFIITFGKLSEQRLFLSEDLEMAYHILGTPNRCKNAFLLRHFLMSHRVPSEQSLIFFKVLSCGILKLTG